MDKKQKQEFNAVLKKYHRSKGDVAKSYFRGLGKGAIFGVALDVIFTGGFGTVAAITAASFPTLKALGRAAVRSGALLFDKRGQSIKASPDVQMILFEQQLALAAAFNQAAKPKPIDPAHTEERKFFAVADEVEEEVRKLRPAIKVLSGGTNNYGTAEYKIMVHRPRDMNGGTNPDLLTLDEARAELKKNIAHKDAVLAAKAQSKPQRTPANDAQAPAPKKRRGFNI